MISEVLYLYMRMHFISDQAMGKLPPVGKFAQITNRDQALAFLDTTLRTVVCEMSQDIKGDWGAFLSGGIDSTLVCSYLKEINPSLKVFTIGSDSKVHNESALAQEYARLMKLDQHLVMMDSAMARDFLDDVDKAITEPFGDFSLIPTTFVAKMARKEGLNACFSGDGGDELFFGYDRFWSVAKNIRYQSWPYAIKYLLYGLDKLLFKNRHINSGVLLARQGEAHRGLHSRFSHDQFVALFPGVKDPKFPEWFDAFNYPNQKNELDLLIKMREAEYLFMGGKGIRKLKLASNSTGLQILTPMMHPQFIEAALQISPYLSYGNGRKKQLLKDLLARRVPGAPIDNRKRGFAIPLSKWIREELRVPFTTLLLDDEMINYFGVDKTVMLSMLDEHMKGVKDHKHAIFTLYTLFRWKKNEAAH